MRGAEADRTEEGEERCMIEMRVDDTANQGPVNDLDAEGHLSP